MSYAYDALGKLLTRADANTGLSETINHDPSIASSRARLAPPIGHAGTAATASGTA